MKKKLLLFLLEVGIFLTWNSSQGQISSTAPADTLFVLPLASDTLPTITIEVDGGLVLLGIIVPAGLLYLDMHSYQIGQEKSHSPTYLKPYLLASVQPEILENHRIFMENRKIWRVTTSVGLVLWLVGIVQTIDSIFDSSAAGGTGALLLMGTASIVGGQVARVISFGSLCKAVDLYNYQYADKKPVVSLHFGLPSSTSMGLGLYVKF